ncbi:MAG TPA: glycoside hydrolase family 27 protein, partial [Bryobacteraceae bacterium]|nr:glycoside hydrolase family 27 protein [Bryobacteraceae bacterium]
MRTSILLLLVAVSSFAADLSGTWRFEIAARDGSTRQTLYIFKADGSAFTGMVVSPGDRRDVVNGKIDGNQFTFDTKFEFDETGRLTPYKGEIAGDSISITPVRTNGKNPPRATTATRVSADTVYHMPPELEHKPFAPFQPIAPNGLAKTPPMGWNSWNKFAGRVDDKAVREIADAMVSSGMRDAGYLYVNIDDTWEGQRDQAGNIQSNQKFPDMKALADYVHSKGLKLGIYSGPGPRTCAGFIASYNHEEQDARTWAAWGIDYLKYDWCSASAVYHRDEMQSAYQKMALALRATGRPIVFSLCQYGWLD